MTFFTSVSELNERTYRILLVVVIVVTGALTAVGINMGIPFLPMITLITGALILQYMRRRTDEVIYDERITIINQKASAAAIAVYTLGVTAVGWLLMTMGSTIDPAYEGLGYTLVYMGCGLLLLRTIFHYYYSWKHGG
jgi:uncharacterized membrane protein